MANIDVEDLLTLSQAAAEKKVTRQAISHLIKNEKIPFVEIAGKKFINRSVLINFQPEKGGRPTKLKKPKSKN